VRIRACGQALCGVISSGDPKETDRHNPDASKRNRSLLGTPVLIDMKSVNSKRWEGEIYNAKNGKTYASNIMLKNPDVLRVEGCVFGGFFLRRPGLDPRQGCPEGVRFHTFRFDARARLRLRPRFAFFPPDLVPRSPQTRASRRTATGHSVWGHPSRRAQERAPQDEVVVSNSVFLLCAAP